MTEMWSYETGSKHIISAVRDIDHDQRR